jgi:hypothetical protein
MIDGGLHAAGVKFNSRGQRQRMTSPHDRPFAAGDEFYSTFEGGACLAIPIRGRNAGY